MQTIAAVYLPDQAESTQDVIELAARKALIFVVIPPTRATR
jgi:hypothetical protein